MEKYRESSWEPYQSCDDFLPNNEGIASLQALLKEKNDKIKEVQTQLQDLEETIKTYIYKESPSVQLIKKNPLLLKDIIRKYYYSQYPNPIEEQKTTIEAQVQADFQAVLEREVNKVQSKNQPIQERLKILKKAVKSYTDKTKSEIAYIENKPVLL